MSILLLVIGLLFSFMCGWCLRNRLVEGTAEERDALHDKTISRRSPDPFDYEYGKPGYTFSGISCLPVSREIQSPDAELIKGGINCSCVTIRLMPVEEGEWACRVVYGRPCTTGPSAHLSEHLHSLLCVTCCTPFVSILDTLVVKVFSTIYESGN